MAPHTPLAKIAAAALAGSLALGGGVALAQLHDSEPVPDDGTLPTDGDVLPDDGTLPTDGDVPPDDGTVPTDGEVLPGDGTLPTDGDGTGDDGTNDDGTNDDGTNDDGTEAGDDPADTKAHPENHGKLVSETARSTPPGPGHGKAVSAVARQNRGHAPAPDDGGDDDGGATSASAGRAKGAGKAGGHAR